MKKVAGAAATVALLLVLPVSAHAWNGQGVQGTGPMSTHAVVVAPKGPNAVVVAPHQHPVVVAPHHGFVRPRAFVGVGVGAPVWWPAYAYPYPAYAYAPPTVYVPPPEPTYWYYCPALGAYYPYVQQCPTEWLTVVPQPTN